MFCFFSRSGYCLSAIFFQKCRLVNSACTQLKNYQCSFQKRKKLKVILLKKIEGMTATDVSVVEQTSDDFREKLKNAAQKAYFDALIQDDIKMLLRGEPKPTVKLTSKE